ncbi:MAG: hypothetical protein JSV18_00725 [Candidatus Bathyarchaeota archaeon]|nr:MAG: hypothetical protein JSV18_00725 [Candidatus Bathyarchaeota archaeon]
MKKYIVFWEWNKEDTEKGIEKAKKIDELRKQEPEKYPKSLGSSYGILGSDVKYHGFTLFEANEKQLKEWEEFYKPVLRITKKKHIISAAKFIEKYEKKELIL